MQAGPEGLIPGLSKDEARALLDATGTVAPALMTTDFNTARELVMMFFEVMWNTWDADCARRILSPEIEFHGSIGLTVSGHDGFLDYMATIRRAFPDLHNRIDEIVAEGDRAVARLSYTGTHRGELLGHAATGRRIEYAGAAFFTRRDGRIARVWVLGDRATLFDQIGG